MSIRRKTCETMTLLYEAALKTNPDDERPPAINPTPGVLPRPALGKAIWVADASKPYGGIWVAQDNEEKADSGLTENSVVLQGNIGKDRPPPEVESTDPTIRARALSRLRGNSAGSGDSDDGHRSSSVNGSYDGQGEGIKVEQQGLSNGSEYQQNQGQGGSVIPRSMDQQIDPMQIIRDLQMTGSNVNPQMNFGMDFSNNGGMATGYNIDVSVHKFVPTRC
jgi:hypothetical protein